MFFQTILHILEQANDFFLGYVALVLICSFGFYLTLKTRAFQLRKLPTVFKTFFGFLVSSSPAQKQAGTHPIQAFFASVGGMIGIGNVVAVTTAVQVGGSGALFWVWIAAALGSVIKYSEIFLGLRFRVPNQRGGYDGGPMFFLREAFGKKWISTLVCLLLCIYGTEIYQFSVIVDSVSNNFNISPAMVIPALLLVVIYSAVGGVSRVGMICSWLMPFFTLTYLGMAFWVVFNHLSDLPSVLSEVFVSAFRGSAPVGGFAGSTVWMAMQQGVARAAYSADIGIGYDSIIQSESQVKDPRQQASLSIFGVLIDNLVCTSSILIVLLTGVWKMEDPVLASRLVQTALSQYFSGMSIFMPLFIFILGYTTIIAYICVCMKCARFLNARWGVWGYLAFSIPTFCVFAFYDQSYALLVMSIAQSLLLLVNLAGLFKLRNRVDFS